MKGYRNGQMWDFEAERPVTGGGGDVILGLDGGTTNTVCVCISAATPFSVRRAETLPILARSVAGCSNHNSVGEVKARETLENVIAQALFKAGCSRSAVSAVCLAVAGVDHPIDQQRILNWLRDIFPNHVKLFVENDAVAALASGTMGKLHGCVLIAGTGTIAYGFTDDGREARAAGAGPILGDWGRWTYEDPSWARIAAILPVVIASAEAGDEVANNILHNSVLELASSVKAVVRKLGLSGEDGRASFPLVMVGRVLEANQRWDIGKEVIDCITKLYPGAHPIHPKVEPAVGAALLAWNSIASELYGDFAVDI
ncbi:uncharacterized protein [Typha angustifolia]|uniref:uncharacterized protein isoform X3 n=1 Tax=Typha angustifolia TaxID=59011 RepID=UPI003C2DE6BE